jgi:PAS domain S-box-containing protein
MAIAAKIVALAAAYSAGGKFGLKLAFLHRSASAVWPPTGIALAALLLYGYRLWPGVWLGAFLVNLTTSGSIWTSIGIAGGNTLEAVLGAWLVSRYANGRHAFDRAASVFRYLLVAPALSTTLSATVGVSSLALGGLASWSQYGPIWRTWWLGDAVSALIVTPLLLVWCWTPLPQWDRRRVFEGMLILAGMLGIGYLAFGGPAVAPVTRYPRFLLYPIAILAAYRFEQRGAITACFLVSAVAICGTIHGLGPFASPDRNEALIMLQAFMASLTLATLTLGVVVAENRRNEIALLRHEKQAHQELAALFNSAMDAIIAADTDQRIVLFNTAAEQMFRCSASYALGKPIDRFIPERFRDAHHQHLREFGRRGVTNRRMGELGALSALRADGEEFPIEASISHTRVGSKKLLTVILRDITVRKRVETELAMWRRELELRVEERTRELSLAHKQLQIQINERKRLESGIARAIEREQLRLGRELHDGLGQQLAGLGYLAAALLTRLEKTSNPLANEARRLETSLMQAVGQTRNLAKGFFPVELERQGLVSALEEMTYTTSQSFGIHCVLEPNGASHDDIRGPMAIQMFRIAQEAVLNAVKHARAKTITIRLSAEHDGLVLSVRDDGIGLPPEPGATDGMGVRIMQYRAHLIGAELLLQNSPKGGAIVTCRAPADVHPASSLSDSSAPC